MAIGIGRWLLKRRAADWTVTAWQSAVCGQRHKIFAATLTVVAATLIVVATGFAKNDEANAQTCPGPLSTTGFNCCPAGSTPAEGDTCQLPGGGLTASCPLGQLTPGGTSCCPLSSTPQPDGTCQPSSGSASAQSCPLGQLNLGTNATAGTWTGLSCCPSGFPPQADGSCAVTLVGPMPQCPPGLDLVGGYSSTALCNGAALPNTNMACPPGSWVNAGPPTPCVANPTCPWPYVWTPPPDGVGVGQCISTVTPCVQSCVISPSAGQCVPAPGSSSATVCAPRPVTIPWPTCPSGFYLTASGLGLGPLTCETAAPSACPVGTEQATLRDTTSSGTMYGCCPASSPNCAVPSAPLCPPGSTAVNNTPQQLVSDLPPLYTCNARPQCPVFFRLSNATGQCVPASFNEHIGLYLGELPKTGSPSPSPLPPPPPSNKVCSSGEVSLGGNCVRISTPIGPAAPLPPAPLPAEGCAPGYSLSADGKECVRCTNGEVPGPNGCVLGPAKTLPVGTTQGMPPPTPTPTGTPVGVESCTGGSSVKGVCTCPTTQVLLNGICGCASGVLPKDGRCTTTTTTQPRGAVTGTPLPKGTTTRRPMRGSPLSEAGMA